jgi:hypothetical protein
LPIATLAFSAFAAAGVATLATQAVREHRDAMQRRGRLLDDALRLFPGARVAIAPDRFPVLTGALADGREVELKVFADTLVTRRLPQLWLQLTLRDRTPGRPTIGALSRPTGAEFYALTCDLPERFDPPFEADFPILVRGRGADRDSLAAIGPAFRQIFADRLVKEAVIAPGGARVIRQVAEGERGAHMVFRQVRFPVEHVPAETVARALGDAEVLLGAKTTARERSLEAAP